jgi:CubicO group peptidase (beta-lactamase class C family)
MSGERQMDRRGFLVAAGTAAIAGPARAAWREPDLEKAALRMRSWVADGRVRGASVLVRQRTKAGAHLFSRNYGTATGPEPIFLLASITKPMTVAAVMTLVDAGKLSLDDPVVKFFPQFTGGGRERITLRHCLTHTGGLPDMLADDEMLRQNHATLTGFRDGAFKAPLKFAPGTGYSYSSMGILIASLIAQKISGVRFAEFIAAKVFRPLGMTRTSMGLMGLPKSRTVPSQAAPAQTEAGKKSWPDWNWNSDYWRNLGAPWGGALGPAVDIGRFYEEFLLKRGTILKPETEALMIANQSPPGVKASGLGFDLPPGVGAPACGPATFGHNGSTGTLSWCDPGTGTICVILTTLYAAAVRPHPMHLVSQMVGQAVV